MKREHGVFGEEFFSMIVSSFSLSEVYMNKLEKESQLQWQKGK